MSVHPSIDLQRRKKQQRRGYRDLAQSVIETAGEDLLGLSEILKLKEDLKTKTNRNSCHIILKKLENDERARKFLASENFDFWCSVLDITPEKQRIEIRLNFPKAFLLN